MAWEISLIAVGLPTAVGMALQRNNIKRICLTSIVVIFGIRYLEWRLTNFPWVQFMMQPEWLWWLLVLIVEIAVLIEVFLFLCTVTWLSNRTDQADRAEALLRTRWKENGAQSIPSVDIFITTYNEGLEVLEKSILGALCVDYPRINVKVLDDGHREWLKDYCTRAGADYIARKINQGAKAGNINNALSQSRADLIMILDADFVCHQHAIWRVAGLFDDQRVATIQTPQSFYNPDALQHNLGIASSWSDEQSYFFRIVARGRDALGVAFCCGSCSIHRRSVLEAVGGFPIDSITEDILLTIRLCTRGWRTIYLAEPISVGLAAESLDSYFIQRKRWGRGGIQVAWLMLGKRGLTAIQRIFFFPYSWITQYSSRIFFQIIPIVFFAIGYPPLPGVDFPGIISYQVPFLLSIGLSMILLSEGYYLPLLSEAISLFNSFVLAPEILISLIKPFGKGFAVTPKGRDSLVDIFRLYPQTAVPASILLGLNLLTLFQVLFSLGESVSASSRPLLMYGCIWCCINIAMLVIAILLSVERPQPRKEHRMTINKECSIINSVGTKSTALLLNLSVTGALCQVSNPLPCAHDREGFLRLDNGVLCPIQKAWTRRPGQLAVSFAELPVITKKMIIGYAFSGEFASEGQPRRIHLIRTLKKILAEIAYLSPR